MTTSTSGLAQGTNDTSATPRRLLLVSVPRTASNLLLKILNIHNQPQIHTNQQGGYFFFSAFVTSAKKGYMGKAPEEWSQDDKDSVKKIYQECLDNLEKESIQAQKDNKAMFVKEHAFWFNNPASLHKMRTGIEDAEFTKSFQLDIPESYGPSTHSPSNETLFSDAYLRTWQIAFIIRHPALAWPSMYRAMRKMADLGHMDEDGVRGSSLANMTMRWSRTLFDWCLEQPVMPVAPPVIDAHDLIHHPETVFEFCDKTGLDKSVLQFEWSDKDDKKNSHGWADSPGQSCDEKQIEVNRTGSSIMLSTLRDSKGIVKDKAPKTIDIDAEAAKWKIEFGEEMGQAIEQRVRDSMPDYEYLKARRITFN